MAHGGNCSEDKRNLVFSSNVFQQMMWMIIGRENDIYILHYEES